MISKDFMRQIAMAAYLGCETGSMAKLILYLANPTPGTRETAIRSSSVISLAMMKPRHDPFPRCSSNQTIPCNIEAGRNRQKINPPRIDWVLDA